MSHWLPQLSTAKSCSIVTDQTHTWHSYRPIRAQRLPPLSCALLGDLHITSLHPLAHTKTCSDTRAHRKRLDSPPQKIGGAHRVFLWRITSLNDRDVTLLHVDDPAGLKRGERACVCLYPCKFLSVVCWGLHVTMNWSHNRGAALHSTWPPRWWAWALRL